MIRYVKEEDFEEIRNIYNYYVENTTISFEETCVTCEEMASRIKTISSEFPFVVYEINHQIVGYAYITKWKSRHAYRYTLETTVYTRNDYSGKGIGSGLYNFLFKELPMCHSIMSVIALPNEKSIALHEKFGFERVADFKEVGYKFNRWIDVAYFQKKMENNR